MLLLLLLGSVYFLFSKLYDNANQQWWSYMGWNHTNQVDNFFLIDYFVCVLEFLFLGDYNALECGHETFSTLCES